MRKGVIYKITNNINGLSYIGKTLNYTDRIRKHKSGRSKVSISKDIQIYGVENFDFEILESDILECHLDQRENHWISFYDTFNNGYNKTSGGESTKLLHTTSNERSGCFIMSHETSIKKSIPIIVYKDGIFKKYYGSQAFANYLGVPRTHVTRGAKHAIRVRGCFVFYQDKTLRDRTILCTKNKEYMLLCKIIDEDVETIENYLYII